MSLRKTKRLISLLMAVCMVACIICAAVVPASATINEAVREDSNGVALVRPYIYVSGAIDIDGTTVRYDHTNIATIITHDTSFDDYSPFMGTAFLINDDTALTCAHVVNHTMWNPDESADVKLILNRMESLRNMGYNVDIECKIVLNKDVAISGKVLNQSVQDDYAVIKLDQALGGKTALPLADSSQVKTTQTVYALGFPGDALSTELREEVRDNRAYDSDDVSVSEGNIQKVTTLNNTDVFQHSATTSGGNSGGPIVDDRGAVIGVHKWGSGTSNEFHWATAINEVKKVLDGLNIDYVDMDKGGEEKPTSAEGDETEAVEETEASATVAAETEAPATTAPAGPNWIIIAIIALVVILIAVVIIIVVVVSKKNKGNGPKGGAPAPGPAPAPNRPAAPAAPTAPPVAQPYNRPQMPMGAAPTAPTNDGAGETSVLNDGAGETTVLGGQGTGFTLMRKSNNEKISINKPEFTIGKERRRVDYCIANNNSVSRVHAKLKVRGGVCYIADLGSTNCTYVNGTKLDPNQEVALKKGDKITISDEDFEMI